MNELDQALMDVQSIRRQVARSTTFQGYGPLTLAGTSLLAVGAAWVQGMWVPGGSVASGAGGIDRFLIVWVTTAVLACALLGAEMWGRTRRIHTGMAHEMLLMAVEQFLPALGVGALVTMTLVRFVPSAVWVLPGFWEVISALGIFASSRFLPKGMAVVAGWYVLAGLTTLALGNARALAPWTMGVGYGVGQMLFAGVLMMSRRNGAPYGG